MLQGNITARKNAANKAIRGLSKSYSEVAYGKRDRPNEKPLKEGDDLAFGSLDDFFTDKNKKVKNSKM